MRVSMPFQDQEGSREELAAGVGGGGEPAPAVPAVQRAAMDSVQSGCERYSKLWPAALDRSFAPARIDRRLGRALEMEAAVLALLHIQALYDAEVTPALRKLAPRKFEGKNSAAA